MLLSKHSSVSEAYKSWLENGGILLTDIQIKKKTIERAVG
jgi:arsenate reductase-like glutaredoxin family protein